VVLGGAPAERLQIELVPIERAPFRVADRRPDGRLARPLELVAADGGTRSAESARAERAERENSCSVSRELRHPRSSCIVLLSVEDG
jgi:hypothetical protein